jgi:hypothetical protein
VLLTLMMMLVTAAARELRRAMSCSIMGNLCVSGTAHAVYNNI